MANANVPPRPRFASQTSLASDSWQTAPSVAESSASASASTSAAAPLVDLNPSIADSANQQSPGGAVVVVSEKRKCWICLVEEGESLPSGNPVDSSGWTKPCACSLDAHESCLITWINQSRDTDTTTVMTCPQCKEPYRLHQNVSVLYKVVSYYNSRINKIVPFIAGFGFISGAYCALTIHGWYALCTFCGPDLALRLFSDANWARPSYIIRMLFGLQFIPIWLLASRTRYFDSILPFIPLAFIEQDHVSIYPHPRLSLTPSGPRYETLPPGLTICVMPWLRIVYNKLWDRFVAPWERKWEAAPQVGGENNIVVRYNDIENAQGNNRNNNNNNNNDNNGGGGGGGAGLAAAAVQAARDQEAVPAAEVDDVVLATNLTAVCRKIVGAMLLPDVCSLCGFLLGQIPWIKRKIPDRFSRNLLGGLVFLVLKDAGSVWFKYNAYKSKQSLRVVDYDRRNRRARAAAS